MRNLYPSVHLSIYFSNNVYKIVFLFLFLYFSYSILHNLRIKYLDTHLSRLKVSTMPSYHIKHSNPAMVFILGGDEDYYSNTKNLDYISIDIDVNNTVEIHNKLSHIKKYKFIKTLFIFIKNIFTF